MNSVLFCISAGENEELSEIETRTIAKQNLLPGEGE